MSSESNFSFTTKINGDLFTVRGDTLDEFTARVGEILNEPGIVADLVTLQGLGHAAPLTNVSVPAAPAAQTYTAPSAVAEAPVAPASGGWGPPAVNKPACQHGPRTGRSGVGAKGEWRAYFCPTAKGTPGQCEPEWVKKGSPEWNNFVAG